MTIPLTILIIDDSEEDRETYKRYLANLSDTSVHYLESDTGDEGLEILSTEMNIDGVLLDYHLPDIDGIEILSELSENKNFAVPVIFLTGQGSENVAVQAMKAGAVDYLVKSGITQDLLCRTVQYAIEKKATDAKLKTYVQELENANRIIVEQQKSIIEEERLKVILQMAGATAHELNQPLMVLLNGIELMCLDQNIPEKQVKYMKLVQEAAERIADIVRKIQTIRNYETQSYAGSSEIVKIDQALT